MELTKEVGKTKAMENIIYLYIFEFFMLSQQLPALQAVAQDVIQRYDGIPLQWKLLYGKDPLVAEGLRGCFVIYLAHFSVIPHALLVKYPFAHGTDFQVIIASF